MLRAECRMVKAGRMGVAGLAGLALVASAGAAACYWRQYPRLVETHLSLLLDYAAKLQALAADRRAVPPARWGEFTYPLERAQDFARIAAKRFPDRASLASFKAAIDVYAGLVAEPRILEGPGAAEDVARRVAALRAAAAATRADLEEEARAGA